MKKLAALILISSFAVCITVDVSNAKNVKSEDNQSKEKAIYMVETSGIKGFNKPLAFSEKKLNDLRMIENKIDDRFEKIQKEIDN